MELEKIFEQNPSIVDVRTTAEFAGGHVAGSINIPLQEIEEHVEKIKNLRSPVIFCCASGGRSGMATQIFMQHGIECYNGGSWLQVNAYKNNKV
jgi:rhodanese-related sulfurtransferase